MRTKGSFRLLVTLGAVPLFALAQPPAATPASPRTTPAAVEVVVEGDGFQVVHVEAPRQAEEPHERDLCVESTGSRVLVPKPDAAHAHCTGHGWSYGSGDVPSDGDMGTALQQLSPVIR